MYSLILHGRRMVQLQRCCNLIVSVQNTFTLSNSFSSANGPKGQNFTVSSYLVDSLGLTTKVAESISKKVSFDDKSNPDAVLDLLRSHGFTDSQISTVITDYPRLLIVDAERSLAPKLQFLQSRGASTFELTEILSKVPKILRMRWEKAISRHYDFVKEIIEADKSYKLCLSLPECSAQGNKIRNISVLRELGIPQKLLFSLLTSNVPVVCGKERFEETIKKVVEMGFDPTTPKFVIALRVFYQMSDKTIEEKVNLYKRLGFDVGDVWAMFKKWPYFLFFSEKNILNSFETFIGLGFTRDEFVVMVKHCPQCIGLSVESVKKKTEFLVKKMNWPLKNLVSNPQVFGLSMEKRIVPRCNVIKALMSKGLLGSEPPSMQAVLVYIDKDFLNKYVRKFADKQLVAELMAIFTGDCVS